MVYATMGAISDAVERGRSWPSISPEAWLFALALTLSSALLFVIEPMLGKLVLPWLGATPAVWTTCMLFFQAALLAGYAYAHAVAKLGPRRLALVHVTALAIAVTALPVMLDARDATTSQSTPVTWLLGALTRAAGLPFLLVAATAPVLQVWFAALGIRGSRDPYFLYAASNFGSLAGLVAYPLLVEPRWTLAEQSRLWAVGYGVLVAVVAVCACLLWGKRRPAPAVERRDTEADDVDFVRRARWVALSFAPSSLMLGATTYITTDLAAMPLLWVVPLALYLLTLVLAFSRRQPLRALFSGRAVCLVSLPLLIAVLTDAASPAAVLLPLHLLALFLGAGSCHVALADDRPAAARLTEYYLWVSFGGVLGGLCNAILAPLVFRGVTEYPLAIVLVCLLGRAGRRPRIVWKDVALAAELAVLIVTASVGARTLGAATSRVAQLGVYLVPALLCYSFVERPVRFALGLGAIVAAGLLAPLSPSSLIHVERNFFGVLRVTDDRIERFHVLVHGNTIHGRQSLDPEDRREPTSYYHRRGPLGQVFTVLDDASSSSRVAAVGLGAGVMAAYARPGDQWTFYEIDPGAIAIARDERYFTFLRDSPASALAIVPGDARLRLREAPERAYDLIVLDAFSSDSIPIHLVTREALALYLEKLAPGGRIAFHVSHRLLDLRPVLGALGAEQGLVARVAEDPPGETLARGQDSSRWVLMARRDADLGAIAADPRWRPLPVAPGATAWTDDFSNLLGAVDWRALGRQLADAATRVD
jgi:SAM-dependent methyltransferase